MTELAQIFSAKVCLQEDEKGREGSIESLRTYREMAKKLEGSRDVGVGRTKRSSEHSKKPARRQRKASTPESGAEQSEISEDEELDSQFVGVGGLAISPKSKYNYIF